MGLEGLQFETVPIAFVGGLDTRTHRKLVIPAKWDDLLNLTLSVDNTPRMRDGHGALLGTQNGNGLATYGAQLLTVSGPAVSSISMGANGPLVASAAVTAAGSCGYVNVSKSEIRRSTAMQDTPDCAGNATFTAYVWREKDAANVVTGVSVTVVDEVTGTTMLAATSMRSSATVFCPRVVLASGAFFIFYIDGTSLYCRVVLAATPTVLGGEVALVTSASLAGLNFDACAFGSSSAMVSYAWSDAATSVRTIRVTQAAGVPSIAAGPTNLFTEAQLPVATLTGICCAAYSSAATAATLVTSTGAAAMSGLAGRLITTAWATSGAATRLDTSVAATTSSVHVTAVINDAFSSVALQVFWDRESEWGTNALNPVRSVVVTDNLSLGVAAGTVFNSATFGAGVTARGPQGPFIAGKAFSSGGRIFLPVFVGSVYNSLSAASSNPRNANTQNSLFILDCNASGSAFAALGTPVVVAKALYGSYGLASINGNFPAVCTPCSILNPSSGAFALVATELTLLVVSGGLNISPTGLVRVGMTPNFTKPLSRLQLGETTYFAGGSLTGFDGVAVAEHGFPLFPEGISLTAGGAGTGSMTDGVHQVVAIYEWTDNAGQRHQSAPSPPVSVTTATGGANTGSITVQVPTLLLSQKSSIFVVAFVTTAAGLTFYRSLFSGTGLSAILNSTAATTVSITINSSDATLAGNEPLYTQPNQATSPLANLSPPPCSFIWTAQNRLFFDKGDKPGWFGYSQPYINNVGLQFAPDLEASLPAESGGFVAGAAMDEKVVIFGKQRIYVMYGTGPQTSGAFNNYSAPQDIQADVGCSDALSILGEFPGGIIFKSQKGWHVLQRDLAVKYIGEGVARFDANTVLAAVLLQDRKECRFVTSGSAGGVTGTTLVYSYLVDQWSYFSQTNGAGYLPLDGMWWTTAGSGSGRYVTISAANGLNQDTPSTYVDAPGAQANSTILLRARTGFLHLAKLEGYQRVRWFYFSATAVDLPTSTLTLTVSYDDVYGGANSYALAIDLGAVSAGLNSACIDLRHKLRHQKCKSVAFQFSQPSSGSTDTLLGFQAMALQLGIKRGVNRLPAAQSVG